MGRKPQSILLTGVQAWNGNKSRLACFLVIACFPVCDAEGADTSASHPAAVPPGFVDVGAEAGLGFNNISGSSNQDFILETMSAGAAFMDYDGDGFQDLFVVNGTRLHDQPAEGRNRLFRNVPGLDGEARRFHEVTDHAGVGDVGWGMGCAVGDYDNDGDVDVLVTNWGPDRLYHNTGNGTFQEEAVDVGVADSGWGSSAAFGDLDADGYLDLYVTRYLEFDLADPPGGGGKCDYKGLDVFCGPAWVPRQPDRLFRNQGGDAFVDVSTETGVDRYRLPALGVTFTDYDDDGDLDIYVANDSEPNLLFKNDGAWKFSELAGPLGASHTEDGSPQAGMGVHSGDYDNDGDFDLFVTNFSDDVNTLYRNDDEHFVDNTYGAGLGGSVRPYLGWGTGFFDFDNDGWLDLFVANGHLYPQLDQHPSGLRYAQRNLLYRNVAGRFTEIGHSAGPGWSVVEVSRGAALGDYDNDGDVDLLVMNMNAPPTLLRNDVGNRHNWLGLELEGVHSNRDGIGARVAVTAGDLHQIREVQRGYGFQSQHDQRLLIGVGSRTRVDSVVIRWPSGLRQVRHDPPLRRYLRVREGKEELEDREYVPPVPVPLVAVTLLPITVPTAPSLSVGKADWSAGQFFNAGRSLYHEGRYEEARLAFESALERDAEHLASVISLGVTLYSGLGLSQDAADLLKAAMARHPTRYEPHFWLGKVYLSLDKAEEAIGVLGKAVALAPLRWDCYHWLGVALVRTDSLDAATTAQIRASKLAPWEPRPHLHLARLYDRLGDAGQARRRHGYFTRFTALSRRVEKFERQAETYPEDLRVKNNLASGYAEQGKMSRALELFEETVALDPDYSRAHYGMGVALSKLEQPEKAIAAFNKALEVDPEFLEALNALGRAYHQASHYDSAAAIYREAVRLRPDLTPSRANLGLAYYAQQEYVKAIAEWDSLLVRESGHERARSWIKQAREDLAGAQ